MDSIGKEGTGQIRVGIGVMVFRDGKLLLGHRCDKGVDTGGIYQPGSWCLPGGKQEFGETMFEGAAREVKEETDLEVEDLYLFGAADSIRSDRHYVTLHIVAGSCRGEVKVTEPDKQDAWEWFELDHLPENLYEPSRLFIDEYLANH